MVINILITILLIDLIPMITFYELNDCYGFKKKWIRSISNVTIYVLFVDLYLLGAVVIAYAIAFLWR